MKRLVPLPGKIWLTPDLVMAMREGYRSVKDIEDPIGSIEFATLAGSKEAGFWVLNFFSRRYVPVQELINVEDMELALSADARERLLGKIVDIKDNTIETRDYPNTGFEKPTRRQS
jgi:hypothetical protein